MNETIRTDTSQQTEPSAEGTPDETNPTEASVFDIDTLESSQDTPPKKRRRVRTTLAVIACLALLVGIGIPAGFFVRYFLADWAADRGNYAKAYEAFTALNNFMDSPERAAEQYKLMRYAQAEELYLQDEFQNAYQIFSELGDFQDAAQRAETAQLMLVAANIYDEAMRFYDKEDFYNSVHSYNCFEGIEVENFRDTTERMESLLVRLDHLTMDYVDQGNCCRTPKILDFLAQKGYPRTEELRSELVAREHIEADDSYYDMDTSRIDSFSGSTTREDFFTLWRYMYLTGTTKLYVPAARSGAAGASYVNQVLERVEDGYYLSEIVLPEYPSIYDWYSEVWWDDSYNMMDYMNVYTRWGSKYTADELAGHMEALDSFCRESIRILNENLLLGASMSNKQKARVIYDWVCFYLTFDQTEETHDAAVAVEERLGVCESYVAVYARMCNLAGVPTYGQTGRTKNQADGETHIWMVQEDENGTLFYTDPTWGDVEEHFAKSYEQGVNDPYQVFCTDYENRIWSSSTYFWQPKLFDSHTPHFEFPYEWVKSVTSG